MKDRYKILLLITAVISALAVLIIYVAFDKYFNEIYKHNAELSILESKKDFLKFTVNNQIIRIEEEIAYEESLLEDLKNEISLVLDSLPTANSTELINFCRRYTEKRVHEGVLTFVVWDNRTHKILYDPAGLIRGINAAAELEKAKEIFAVYGIEEFGSSALFYGVKHDVIDQKVKKKIAAEIHNSKFPLDSYIWINEVVNYEGGDNYAIRRVHPNLKETEGMFLSTEMKDIKGATPYLTELEGVKKDGEIFFRYYFKKKTEDRVAEKLTYAKLYKRYNWIVAFGTHLEDMAKYTNRTEEASKGIIAKLVLALAALIALLMFVGHVAIVYLENRYHLQRKKEFEDEISKDVTTGALTRRSAEKFLEADFENFRRSGTETAYIMMDMDNLKTINDTYGHDAGDAMLKNTVDIIKGQIRHSDSIFRWGGDEFVIVCQGLRPENVIFICEKWTQAVKDSEIEHEGKMISTTISIGISYFRDDDKESSDVIDRADEAMYRAKRGGKDRVELSL